MEDTIYKSQGISPLQPKDFMYKHKDMPLISLLLICLILMKIPAMKVFVIWSSSPVSPIFNFYLLYSQKSLLTQAYLSECLYYILTFTYIFKVLDGIFIQGELLQPQDHILFQFGILCPSSIQKNFQLHRLICSQFLTTSLLIYGSYFEKLIGGKLKCVFFYLIAGTAGGIFSCNLGGAYSIVNSSDGNILFIVVVLINLCEEWHLINYPGSGKYQMIGLLLLGMYFNVWFGIVYSKINWISQLGTMFVATLLGIGWGQNSKLRSKKQFAPIKISCVVLLVVFFLTNFLFFYFFKQIQVL